MAKNNSWNNYDVIGPWSEVKRDLISDYAKAYSKILSNQEHLEHAYVEGFAGTGRNISKSQGYKLINGTTKVVFEIDPPFHEYHFIELNPERKKCLEENLQGKDNAFFYEGNCNEVLPERILPRLRYEEYRRGLCLLDPYGLHLDWEIIEKAGNMGTVDLFLNFPVHDMNRTVLWHNTDELEDWQINRMNKFWGDDSWRDVAYETKETLFDFDRKIKRNMDHIVSAFRERMREEAGFEHVPEPVLFRNQNNAPLYYIFFGSQNDAANDIVKDIFNKYRYEL
ncbi:three-Cys-motif partner protein TcmP [Candidatus Bipolaricaulota bacterium]|nr:three-Cys-motif partner protein TcmP [Candidatus Bipolaricaulota bacterium]